MLLTKYLVKMLKLNTSVFLIVTTLLREC